MCGLGYVPGARRVEVMISSRTAILELEESCLGVVVRAKCTRNGEVELVIGQFENRDVAFEIPKNELAIFLADVFIFLGHIGADVG